MEECSHYFDNWLLEVSAELVEGAGRIEAGVCYSLKLADPLALDDSTTGSSILVPAAPFIQHEFGVQTREIVTLTTALYVAGLGCGPFVFAPLAELYGRQMAYSSSMLGFTIMNLACCFAPK